MRRLLWSLRRYARPLAMWGGLFLLVVSVAVNGLAVRPLEDHLAALEQSAGRRGRQLELRLDAASDPRAQLDRFYATFERTDKLTTLLGTLHAVGRARGLELKRAEYRLSSTPESKLDRYQVVMPIRGSYQAVRSFIANALRELPTMTLDQVQFQRQEIGDALVDAQLTMTFHLAR